MRRAAARISWWTSRRGESLPTVRVAIDVQLKLDRYPLEVAIDSDAHVIGVFGPSGAGKTSLLEAVAGLRPDARGTIVVGGEVWLDSRQRVCRAPEARSVGYVPQDALLFPHLDVRQNLLAGSRRARSSGVDVDKTLLEVSTTLGLEPLWARPVSMLSGGERQRVALGRALCSAPRLLLLDEPLSALDLPLRRRLLSFIRRVRDAFDVPMLVVSHDPAEVQALCDELCVIRAGRVVASGEPHDILADPAVFELASVGGYENTLPCVVVATDAEGALVRVGTSVQLATRSANAPVGASTLVGIPARDVIVATSRPSGISARNVIDATVTAVREAGRKRTLTARIADDTPDLVVELSDAACDELALRVGLRVHLVFKAASCVLYPAESAAT